MDEKRPKYGPGLLPVEYTPIVWSEIVVGEEVGPVVYQINPDTHRKHTEHLGMKHPWYTEKSPWGGPLLYVWQIYCGNRVLSQLKYGRLNQGLVTAIKWEFFKPVVLGTRLSGRATIIEKYQKRGKDYYKVQATTANDKGEKVFRSTCEFITLVGFEGKVRDETESREAAPEPQVPIDREKPGTVVRATKDLVVGYELPSHTTVLRKMRHGTEESGGRWDKELWHDNIHTDEYAQQMGFKAGAAEGPIIVEMALLETLVNFFGESFFTSGVVDVKVIAPVYVGDVFTGKAKVAQKLAEDSGTRLLLDVRVEKQDGTLINVGTVSALVS